MSFIFIHELGHFLAAKYYHWNTDKIYIYPLGGITRFNDAINKPLKEEFIIILMGPIFQIIYYHILTFFNIEGIFFFHGILLGFNLLPIYPLDGGKILNILFSYFLPYRISYQLTIGISYIVYIVVFFVFLLWNQSMFFYIVLVSLLWKIIEEYQRRNYYLNKFLLERYLKEYHFKKKKYITKVQNMFRDRVHLFRWDQHWITEKEMLKKYFHFVKK